MAEVAVAQDEGRAIGAGEFARGVAHDFADGFHAAGEGKLLHGADESGLSPLVARQPGGLPVLLRGGQHQPHHRGKQPELVLRHVVSGAGVEEHADRRGIVAAREDDEGHIGNRGPRLPQRGETGESGHTAVGKDQVDRSIVECAAELLGPVGDDKLGLDAVIVQDLLNQKRVVRAVLEVKNARGTHGVD